MFLPNRTRVKCSTILQSECSTFLLNFLLSPSYCIVPFRYFCRGGGKSMGFPPIQRHCCLTRAALLGGLSCSPFHTKSTVYSRLLASHGHCGVGPCHRGLGHFRAGFRRPQTLVLRFCVTTPFLRDSQKIPKSRNCLRAGRKILLKPARASCEWRCGFSYGLCQ
jgi:hypothetical protein